jgi:hypothetical protein
MMADGAPISPTSPASSHSAKRATRWPPGFSKRLTRTPRRCGPWANSSRLRPLLPARCRPPEEPRRLPRLRAQLRSLHRDDRRLALEICESPRRSAAPTARALQLCKRGNPCRQPRRPSGRRPAWVSRLANFGCGERLTPQTCSCVEALLLQSLTGRARGHDALAPAGHPKQERGLPASLARVRWLRPRRPACRCRVASRLSRRRLRRITWIR